MGDFDRPRRGWRVAAGGAVLAVALGAGAWWWLRPPVPVPAAAGTARRQRRRGRQPRTVVRPATSAPDGGQGWTVPAAGRPGRRGHRPGGAVRYTRDRDGAALAAVNAVVAARYLAWTFPDPWAALGFLADPRFADRGGNASLEAFFTGPAPAVALGPAPVPADPTTAAAPAAVTVTSGGARVLGVRVTGDPAAQTVRVVVLWQRFSLQGDPDRTGRPGYRWSSNRSACSWPGWAGTGRSAASGCHRI